MADLKVIVIGIIIMVTLFGLIIMSANIHTHQIASENIIIEAKQTFLDTVTDRGAIVWNDYDSLITRLAATGGTFEVYVTVHRMFAIPDTSPLSPVFGIAPAGQEIGFTRDYRPVHGLSTRDGSFTAINPMAGGEAVFLRRHDMVTLRLEQTSMMQHQVNALQQLNMQPGLRTWTLARASRNSGHQLIEGAPPPMPVE